jgi:hypothetical protein
VTRRPRAHQIEDRSRLAFGRVLPAQWVMERVAHDYGLDVRVEIFTDDGRATGQMFFAQLKSTDKLPTRNGLSVRVKPDHLAYWNSMAVPTMLVVWVAPTDELFWRWTHRHHPWPRTHTPQMESFRFTAVDRWQPGDEADVRLGIAFAQKARSGGLRAPVDVRFEDYRRDPLTPADRGAFVERWHARVDPSIAVPARRTHAAQAVVQLGYVALQVQLGRAIVSLGHVDDRKLSVEQLVEEVAAMLGLTLSAGGNVDMGLALIAAHGPHSRLLAVGIASGELPGISSFLTAIAESRRFGVAMDLVEAWAATKDELFTDAAMRLLLLLELRRPKIPVGDHARLLSLLDRIVPEHKVVFGIELRLRLADDLARAGRVADALDQYDLMLGKPPCFDVLGDDALARLAEIQGLDGRHLAAAHTLAALVHRHPKDDEWRLRYGWAMANDGNYGIATVALSSVTAQPLMGVAWARYLTAGLAMEACAGAQQTRQPAGAEALSRSLATPDDPKLALELFRKAAMQDALERNTWRLYFLAAQREEEHLPFGAIGTVPLAVLVWDDPEWWALVAEKCLRGGHATAFLRTIECALYAVGDALLNTITDGGSMASPEHSSLPGFVRGIAELRSAGQVLHVRDEPFKVGVRDAIAISTAPEGFRQFPEPPPLEHWCPPPSAWNDHDS